MYQQEPKTLHALYRWCELYKNKLREYPELFPPLDEATTDELNDLFFQTSTLEVDQDFNHDPEMVELARLGLRLWTPDPDKSAELDKVIDKLVE